MFLKKDNWYFLNGFGGRTPKERFHQNHVKVFCRRADYDVLVLVSKEVLKEIKYEPEVRGFSLLASYKEPYPLYAVGLNTKNYQPLVDKYIDKYPIEAILRAK